MTVDIKILDKSIDVPQYQTPKSAAFDISSAISAEIAPFSFLKIPTGLIIKTPENYFLLIAARSSLAIKKGLILANGIGIIDSDFSGPNDEINLMVFNITNKISYISKNERLAQGLFLPINQVTWNLVECINSPNRGGFGSTGGYNPTI